MPPKNDEQVLILLGEIKGELEGIHRLVEHTSEATRQRIDDLRLTVDKRIDDHRRENDKKFSQVDDRFKQMQSQITRRSVVSGSTAGAMVMGVVELIKNYFN